MTTPLDIIALALHDAGIIGVGQTANAEDSNRAFIRMNQMIGQWATKRWLVYHLIDKSVTSTGAQSYTVGPGGDINMAVRPNRLEAAFFRQLIQSVPNQLDFPLKVINARENYNNIGLKQLTSFPSAIFYDTDWPLGRIYPWPIPQPTIYEVHITVKEVLSKFVTLTQTVVLPDEYFAALHYNMCVRLRAAYNLPPKPEDIALAKDALNTIRGSNNQIAELTMPASLVRPAVYNPYSDQVR